MIASAVLATAYVSAFNSKLYVVATVIGFSGILLTTVSFTVGYVQWRSAIADEGALAEVEDRIADRLGIEDFGMPKKRLPEQFSPTRGFLSITAFCLAALLNIGSIVYVIDR